MPADTTVESITLNYDGKRGEIVRLSALVALLTLVTLSFYRFWATTRVRRYFWGRIKINGEALEYSGTGRELFIGFAKVVGILAVLGIPIRLLQAVFITSPWVVAPLGMAQSIALFFLYNFAIYYARRYRLTRTQWRGIRFNLTGSPRKFMSLNLRYGALMGITLGLAYPFWSVASQRYLLSQSWFGDHPFSCQVRIRGLFVRWALVWGLYVGTFVVFIFLFRHDLADFAATQGAAAKKPPPAAILGMAGLIWGLLILVLPIGIWYRLVEFRTIADGVRLDGLSFRVTLGFGRILGLIGKTALAWTLLAIVSGLVVFVAGPFGIVAGLVLIIVGASVISRAIVSHGLLNRLFATTTVTGVLDLSSIGQTTAPVPRLGEGLLEAFDFGG